MSTSSMTADAIRQVLVRYFVELDRSEDVAQVEEPDLEVGPDVIDIIFNQNLVHDEDYIVFKHFNDETQTVLDVGANYGYSALTMWQVGQKAAVASFEPIAGFGPVLEEIARKKAESRSLLQRLFGKRSFEYFIMGLSDQEGQIEFYTSVVNGRMQSALTTALKLPSIEDYVRITCEYAEKYIGAINSFKIYAFTSPVTTLDRWRASGKSRLNLDRIIAIKIDAEGYEGHVLRGASDILKNQKPLIMAEGGHYNDLALRTVFELGYSFAERDGDRLHFSEGPSQQVNGFFLHPANTDYYRRIGLVSE